MHKLDLDVAHSSEPKLLFLHGARAKAMAVNSEDGAVCALAAAHHGEIGEL